MELTNRKRQIQDVEPSCCTSSTSNKKLSSVELCNQQQQCSNGGQDHRGSQGRVKRASTPPLYVFENEASSSFTSTTTRRDSISSYENIVYIAHSAEDDTTPKTAIKQEHEPVNQVRSPHQRRGKQKQSPQFLAALDKDFLLPDHLQSPLPYTAASYEKKEQKNNSVRDSASFGLVGGLGSMQQQSPHPIHTFDKHTFNMMTQHSHYAASSSLKLYPQQVQNHTTSTTMLKKEKKGDTNTNAKISTITSHQSTIDEEGYDGKNRVYLHATLNFPYKEFMSKNEKDHIKIWKDDEEQTRLERHFNPKWQVDFLSMFYSPEGKVHEETIPTTTTTKSPIKSQKDEKVVSDTTQFKPNQAKEKRKEEVILIDATNKDASNTDNPNSFSPISLEEAAENLCDAMDVSDVTRDAIARIENQMQINRREFFSSVIRDIH
jgi:hypothetical protein